MPRYILAAGQVAFAEENGKVTSDIQICRVGKWDHPYYGEFEITKQTLKEFVKHFKEEGRDVVVDYQHGSLSLDPEISKAAGWAKDLFLKEGGTELWATVEWTSKAVEYIKNEEFKYISPEIDFNHKDKETGEKIGPTILAIALCVRPWIENMEPVSLKEGAVFETASFQKSPSRGTQRTPPKGGIKMNEKRIRELLNLAEDVEITSDHQNQALEILDEKLAEAEGKVTQLTEKQPKPGTITLTETEVTALRANAEAGAQAAQRLKEMQVGTALSDAQRAGKVAGKDTPLYAQVKKALEADYAGGIALIEALPKVVQFGEVGADGGSSAGGAAEIGDFILRLTTGEKAVSMVDATAEAYKKFPKDQVDAWRFRKAS